MREQAGHTFSVAGVHGVQQKGPPPAGLQVFPQDGLEGVVAIGAGAASHCPVERDACTGDTLLRDGLEGVAAVGAGAASYCPAEWDACTGNTQVSPGCMQAKMHPHARL
jgi:hypothetical protein